MTYHVKELRAVSRYHADIPVLASGFADHAAAEVWLINYLSARRLLVLARDVDDGNDAIDLMAGYGAVMRQFAIEPEDRT